MSSTERKAFLQRRTSTAVERAAYRAKRNAERKAFNKTLMAEYRKLVANGRSIRADREQVMARFTKSNTSGYCDAALAVLNRKFEEVIADNYDPDALAEGYYDSVEYKSWQDWIAEMLLEDFR